MRWHHWFRNGLTQPRTGRISRPRPPGRGRLCPRLEQFEDRIEVVYNDENIGFAAAQNQAIRLSSGDWVLTLNPDVLLLPKMFGSGS